MTALNPPSSGRFWKPAVVLELLDGQIEVAPLDVERPALAPRGTHRACPPLSQRARRIRDAPARRTKVLHRHRSQPLATMQSRGDSRNP